LSGCQVFGLSGLSGHLEPENIGQHDNIDNLTTLTT
jgi:hypothetical protein